MIRASGVSLPLLRISAPQLCQLLHYMASGTFMSRGGERRPPSYSPQHRNNCSSAHIVQMTWAAVCISVSPPQHQQCGHWTHLLISDGLWDSEVSCYKLVQNTWHYLDVYLFPVPSLAGVWWPVCGPGVTCSWHWPIFRGAQHLRVASLGTGQLSPGPGLGPFTGAGGWWLMMLNNLQFARDHSPGYKMPHCFSQSTFNKMQRGYFMIFLQSPHLSFKMGGT